MPKAPLTNHRDLHDLGEDGEWTEVERILDAWAKTPPPSEHIAEQLSSYDSRSDTCWPVLHHAAAANHGSMVKRLLDMGADPYLYKGRGKDYRYSPLGISAYWASPDALRAFMQHGCEVYLRSPKLTPDEPGSTLLHRLMRTEPKGDIEPSSQYEVIGLLVQAYDNPMRLDENGNTPLDLADSEEKRMFFVNAYERCVLTEEAIRTQLLASSDPIETVRRPRRRL